MLKKSLVSAAVSIITLAALYSILDTRSLLAVLATTDSRRLLLSMVLLLALIFVSAFRLKVLVRVAGSPITLRTAVEATCAANALNLVLPGRIGDLAKSPMLRTPASASVVSAINLSVYDKAMDFFAILAWGGLGLAFQTTTRSRLTFILVIGAAVGLASLLMTTTVPRLLLGWTREVTGGSRGHLERFLDHWFEMVSRIMQSPKAVAMVMALAVMVWAGHFVQIGMMAWSLGVPGPWGPFTGALPVVILAGLVPLTIAGIGPRDAAIVLLLGPLIGSEKAASLGVLFWLRDLVPGLVGLPVVGKYSRSVRALKA